MFTHTHTHIYIYICLPPTGAGFRIHSWGFWLVYGRSNLLMDVFGYSNIANVESAHLVADSNKGSNYNKFGCIPS